MGEYDKMPAAMYRYCKRHGMNPDVYFASVQWLEDESAPLSTPPRAGRKNENLGKGAVVGIVAPPSPVEAADKKEAVVASPKKGPRVKWSTVKKKVRRKN